MIFVLYSLICWRVSYFLVAEDGPDNLMESIRKRLRSEWSPLDCFYCTSVWVSFVLAYFTDDLLLYWLPLSAVAILIEAVHRKLQ